MHITGAIYRRVPANDLHSGPVGSWNLYEVEAMGRRIEGRLNGHESACLEDAPRRTGHIALQAHHEGSAVQFRDLIITPA
jgi:hypothetical protein